MMFNAAVPSQALAPVAFVLVIFPENPKHGFKAFESTLTVALPVFEHPFASTTVTEYVPIHRLDKVFVVNIPPMFGH